MDLPLLGHSINENSVFTPESLLARAADMRGASDERILRCCVLDGDNELGEVAKSVFGVTNCNSWPCFHTTMLTIHADGLEMGLIGGTVGAPFAVLIAEQLIALGYRHVVGYSSAGSINNTLTLLYLMVPDRAIRDEGTSFHYLPPAATVEAVGELPSVLARQAQSCGLEVHRGTTWTTDAPYCETQTQVDQHRAGGVLSVEMEAAALMALAKKRGAEIASLLHVTNAMGTQTTDFNKGPDDINERVIRCCLATFAEAIVD
ncbi:MAG: uridine phosphorylase [Candidatus Latescibacteria bacterium]|nr:uridine phosphorylase [Candidatus Latescibacterota bacterium]